MLHSRLRGFGLPLLAGLFCLAALAQRNPTAAGPVAGKNRHGAPLTADSLANLEIGKFRGREVDYRFRARRTGTISAVRVYFIFRKICPNCYANGSGGIVDVRIYKDDGTPAHLPSQLRIGSATVADPLKEWNRLISFDPPANVTNGDLYHIVFSNSSPDPVQNFVSVDDLYSPQANSAQPAANSAQPAANSEDLAVLLKSDGRANWAVNPRHIPILCLYYTDGFRQGQAFIDVKHSDLHVSPDTQLRQTFKVKADMQVNGAAIRALPQTASGAVLYALTDVNERTIASGTVPAADEASSSGWLKLPFSSAHLLKAGAVYHLAISSSGGASLRFTPFQSGESYGFASEEPLQESHCEMNAGSGWTNCFARNDLVLPFYLETTISR